MSYCLRYKNAGAARTISEVRNEIWAMTTHIMDKAQARWKVILVNTEPVDADEVDGTFSFSFYVDSGGIADFILAWTSLAEQHNKTHPGSLELTILTVTTAPDLVLEPPPSFMSMNVFNPQSSSTPVTTPNPSASIASPEQYGTAATPSAAYNAPTPTDTSPETDSEAILADICDEAWMVILSHRLNSSPHLTEFRPALASGYLLRRKGASDADGVFAMTVNLIYTQRPSSASHEGLLKETMGMYRDLASLARAKGIRSVQGNIMPWHIATALRAQELLSYVL
jgi:mediator of RNA polymerase II transcription subunit 13